MRSGVEWEARNAGAVTAVVCAQDHRKVSFQSSIKGRSEQKGNQTRTRVKNDGMTTQEKKGDACAVAAGVAARDHHQPSPQSSSSSCFVLLEVLLGFDTENLLGHG